MTEAPGLPSRWQYNAWKARSLIALAAVGCGICLWLVLSNRKRPVEAALFGR